MLKRGRERRRGRGEEGKGREKLRGSRERGREGKGWMGVCVGGGYPWSREVGGWDLSQGFYRDSSCVCARVRMRFYFYVGQAVFPFL